MRRLPHRSRALQARRALGARVASIRGLLRRLPALLALVGLLLGPTSPAAADVNGAMENYFNSMGAAANVTGPSAYNGQRAGYYSLGNIYTRFPQKTLNPASIQLPGYRAGCGGIDLFAGSFSFVNSSEIVAMMKAVANNAVGFAFKLAIDTLCPECGATMSDLSQRVQQMNNAALNSCQLAQGLVNTVAGKSDLADRNFCETIAPFKGVFSDAAASMPGCGNTGERASAADAAAADPALKDASPMLPRNFTWEALKKAPLFNQGGTFDRQLAEFAMTLVGTAIYIPGKTKDEPASFDLVAGDANVGRLLLDGTSASGIKVMRCDDDTTCLKYTMVDAPTLSKPLKARVSELIDKMITSINTDAPLTGGDLSAAQNLLQVASIPLYKILTVNAAYGRGIYTGDKDSLAEITSVDLLFAMLKEFSDEVQRGRNSLVGVEDTKLTMWASQLDRSRNILADQQHVNQGKVQETLGIVQRTSFIESILQSQMSPALNASLDWSRGVSAMTMR